MTREETIKICIREKDCVQAALDVCADGGHYVSPDGIITAADYVEAMGLAISALREQEERSKGCEFCAETLKRFDHVLAVADYCEDDIVYEPKFCPMCGRRLEEV